MKMRKLILLMLLCLPLIVVCQNIQFTAKAPSAVGVGEQFRLTYTVNANVSDFKYSSLDGFTILSGPNPSTSSNIMWVNGQTSQSISTTYTFYLSANHTGSYTISPATVTVNRKKYVSNAVIIKVVQGSSGKQIGGSNIGGNNRGYSNSFNNGSDASVSSNGKDIFVVGSASKKNVYVGEQLVFSHRIYTKYDLAGFSDVKFPAYTGFWKEDVDIGNINLQRTTVGNEAYYSDEIQRNILFPQKAGDIVIEPATIKVVARVKSKQGSGTGDPFFDSFFQNYQNVNYTCVTKPVTIHVISLPTKGQPTSFSGAVGNFSMTGTIDKTSLKANEAITIRFTISGTGNVKLIDKLNIQFPYDFEVYEPKISENIKVNNDAVNGTKVFEYVVIPRNPGSYRINSFEFSFFNPAKQAYETLHSSEFNIHVDNAGVETQSVQSVNREDVVSLGEDIRYIKVKQPNFKSNVSSIFATPVYFIIIGAILLVFLAGILLARKYLATISDVEGLKRRHADAVALKRLKKAKAYLDAKDQVKFYDEISTALWQYVSDRFNAPTSELSRDYLRNIAKNGKLSENDVNKFIEVIDNAEFARFAPGNTSDSMSDIYSQAEEVIKLFYSKLK